MKKQITTLTIFLLSGTVAYITAMDRGSEGRPKTAVHRLRRRRRPTTPARAQMRNDLSRQTARLKAEQQQLLLSALFLAHRTAVDKAPSYLRAYHYRTMPVAGQRSDSRLSTTSFTLRKHRLYERSTLPAHLENQWKRIQEAVVGNRRVNRIFMRATAEDFNTVEFYRILYGQYAPRNQGHRFIPGDPHRTTLPARLR